MTLTWTWFVRPTADADSDDVTFSFSNDDDENVVALLFKTILCFFLNNKTQRFTTRHRPSTQRLPHGQNMS